MTDEEDLARELVAMIKEHVEKVVKPLRDQIASFEAEVKFLRSAGVNFRGPFEDGETYVAGDAVMRNGCLWRACETTTKQPPGEGWRLMVRKGRDGKDAR